MADWHAPKTWKPADMKLTARIFNYEIRDLLRWLRDYSGADAEWETPTLVNSWTDYGSGQAPAAYIKEGQYIYLRGLVDNGTAPSVIFTLPVDYRPPYDCYFLARTTTAGGADGIARMSINTDGEVFLSAGTPWVSLNELFFRLV